MNLLQQVQQVTRFYEQHDSAAFFERIDNVLHALAQHEWHEAWTTLMLQKAMLYMQLSNDSLASHTLADVAAVIENSGIGQRIDYYTTLAALQQASGSNEEAFDSLHIAEAFAQQHGQHARLRRIYFYKSVHYAALHQYDSSLYYAKRAAKDADGDAHMLLNLAQAFMKMQQFDEAFTCLQAIEHMQEETPYVLVKAEWLVAQKQQHEAEQMLRQQLKKETMATQQERIYEKLCPLVKQLHAPSEYVADLRRYYALIERIAQQDRNTKVAAISHYFNDRSIQSAAWIDSLTHVYNRKFLEENMTSWTAEHPTFTVAMFDIDKFKPINDTYGHLVGDEVIQLLAKTAKETLHQSVVIRYGGDEFILLWTHNDKARIEADLQQLQQSIANVYVEHEGTRISFTISIGVDLLAMATSQVDTLLHKADEALYKAKENGRNQYVIA